MALYLDSPFILKWFLHLRLNEIDVSDTFVSYIYHIVVFRVKAVVFENTLSFQALIEDLRLKGCILWDNTKLTLSRKEALTKIEEGC